MPRLRFKFLPTIPLPSPAAIKDTIGLRRLLRTKRPLTDFYPDPDSGIMDPEYFPADHDDATLVISKMENGQHMPVIDIDLPCTLIPSSKPGHFHLYINQPMSWWKFTRILEALEDAGVVQEGYLKHSKRRGYTTVRYPGITKSNEEARIRETLERDGDQEALDALDELVEDAF